MWDYAISYSPKSYLKRTSNVPKSVNVQELFSGKLFSECKATVTSHVTMELLFPLKHEPGHVDKRGLAKGSQLFTGGLLNGRARRALDLPLQVSVLGGARVRRGVSSKTNPSNSKF